MIPPAPSKLLVGISLELDHSNELLSWATRVLAQPNDTIVAVYVLVGEESKKLESMKKKQWQIRQAKAHVISVLGEFARTCQSKQINLEARVGFSSSIARGLIEEVKSISADYLLLRRLTNQSNRSWHRVIRYCFENAPETCTVLSLGKRERLPDSATIRETHQPSSRWVSRTAASSVEKHINSETRRLDSSPRTVLDEIETESHSTEDDTFSFGGSSTTESPPMAANFNGQSKTKKQMSTCKLFSSIFASPMRKRNGSVSNKEKQQSLLKCFNYEEISRATNKFHPDNVVGRGGYSEVYRGDLSDGRAIAVKMLARDNKDATKEKEFLLELGITGHVCHPNTASLLGCCIENGLYLIFNFSQNGNLASALHSKTGESLQWPVRHKIALGVARGLHYLHKCCKHRIIHRDIKASNVLLGPDYEPQISDFGLAKWLPNKWTHHAVIPIEGTFGYIAPEYFMHGIVDEKTDVYAFGVLLLEIITGRRPVDSSKQNLLLWARPLMESGNIMELADPGLEGKFDSDQMNRVVLTASYCARQSSTWRPSMSEVLELLTSGHDSEVARSWRMPKFASDELDDYSTIFGYDAAVDIAS
ncbi:hypothetical protein OIU85_012489 [Salix viminalis]|uniref:Protein kinase domain-containing protein n=1 Tax=Salix viminalis TaxID=40686 RepID=A0A9Q0NPD6_SALVM|nr:hypothetical protein OIU85_012489 [Salix viminalis]